MTVTRASVTVAETKSTYEINNFTANRKKKQQKTNKIPPSMVSYMIRQSVTFFRAVGKLRGNIKARLPLMKLKIM